MTVRVPELKRPQTFVYIHVYGSYLTDSHPVERDRNVSMRDTGRRDVRGVTISDANVQRSSRPSPVTLACAPIDRKEKRKSRRTRFSGTAVNTSYHNAVIDAHLSKTRGPGRGMTRGINTNTNFFVLNFCVHPAYIYASPYLHSQTDQACIGRPIKS